MMSENTKRAGLYLTKSEHNELVKEFTQSELAGSRDTYGHNHPLSEYTRRILGDNPEADVGDYDGSPSKSREYSRTVTIEFPLEQYESLKEQFRDTPVAEDANGRGAYAGNSPFAEYLRRCLQHYLTRDE